MMQIEQYLEMVKGFAKSSIRRTKGLAVVAALNSALAGVNFGICFRCASEVNGIVATFSVLVVVALLHGMKEERKLRAELAEAAARMRFEREGL